MKTMNLKVLASGIMLAATVITSAASADYGYGRDDRGNDRGRDDRGRDDRGRDDRGRGEDLCSGRYVGSYSNGYQAVIDFSPSYGDSIYVRVILNGQRLDGSGSCRQYGDRAQWEFTTLGVYNSGTIDRGYMSGGQPGGAYLSARKQ